MATPGVTELGAIGIFGFLVIKELISKISNTKDDKKGSRCIHDPFFIKSLTDQDTFQKDMRQSYGVQVVHLKNMVGETKKQTKILNEIAKNGKKKRG